MDELHSDDVEIVIKSVGNEGIIIRDTKQFTEKGEEIKTTEYFLEVEDHDMTTIEESTEAQYIQVQSDCDEDQTAQFVAVDIEDNGDIILHDKDIIVLDELCRICASESDRLIPIFSGEGLEHELCHKIHTHLPLKISENDTLPLQVCYNCAATLVAWHEMFKGCLDAQQRLSDIQEKCNLKAEEQYYNNTVMEDENMENVLEMKEINKEEPQVETKIEDNADQVQIVNLTDSDRSKNPQRTCTSFKEFRKTYKPTFSSAKGKKRNQTTSKSVKKRTTRATKKMLVAKVSEMKIEAENRCTISKHKMENADNINLVNVKMESIPLTNTDDEELDEDPETKESPSEKSKKPRRKRSSAGLQCNQCNKKFRLDNSYQMHMKLHTGEKPYTCHICSKQFGQTGSLYYHLKHVHGGVKNHACDICGRCFAMKTAMEDHRRIHTGERPYVCDSCGKTFKTKASLYIHSKIHTNEYPFKCTYCKKLFRWKQQMISHETTHTGEKNHICDICGKGFGVKNELTRHRRTHSSDKPFTCHKCGVSFGQKRYLTNHNRTRHKTKTTSNS